MYNGKLIGDLFDAVERAQSPAGRQWPQKESSPPPRDILPVSESVDSPIVQPAESRAMDKIL